MVINIPFDLLGVSNYLDTFPTIYCEVSIAVSRSVNTMYGEMLARSQPQFSPCSTLSDIKRCHIVHLLSFPCKYFGPIYLEVIMYCGQTSIGHTDHRGSVVEYDGCNTASLQARIAAT